MELIIDLSSCVSLVVTLVDVGATKLFLLYSKIASCDNCKNVEEDSYDSPEKNEWQKDNLLIILKLMFL